MTVKILIYFSAACFIIAIINLYRKYKIVLGGCIVTGKIYQKRNLLVSSCRKWCWKYDYMIEINQQVFPVLFEPFYFIHLKKGDHCKVYIHPKRFQYVVLVYDIIPELTAILLALLGMLFLYTALH